MADLMEAYQREMQLRLIEVRYEDLVDDADRELRRMLELIGLPFEASCLEFTNNARYARTASHAQVTENLYSRSRYRWRRYRKQLEPAATILRSTIERLGYNLDEAC